MEVSTPIPPVDRWSPVPLLNLYGVAVDAKRWDYFDRVFADDVLADYGDPVVFQGLAAFKHGAAQAWGPFDASQHSMSNTVWRNRGDRGWSLTYGDWFIIRRGAPGGEVWQGKGWYHDEWVLRGEDWRIARRCCRTMWWTGNPLVPNANFQAGDTNTASGTCSLAEAIDAGLFGFFDQ